MTSACSTLLDCVIITSLSLQFISHFNCGKKTLNCLFIVLGQEFAYQGKHAVCSGLLKEATKLCRTWWSDLSPCLRFFLADDVTFFLSLYTIKVSSSSAIQAKSVHSKLHQDRGFMIYAKKNFTQNSVLHLRHHHNIEMSMYWKSCQQGFALCIQDDHLGHWNRK